MPNNGAAPRLPRRLATGLFASAGTLLVQLLLVAVAPGVAGFDKYPRAAELAAAGALSPERLLDFSPLYLWLVEIAGRLFTSPRLPLVALQIALVALAAGAVASRAHRQLPRAWALFAAALLACDPSVAAYARTLEPEIVQLACAATCLALLPASRPSHAALAGLLAAASLATRGTLAPLLLVGVPVAQRLELGAGNLFRRTTLAFLAPLLATGLLLQLRAQSITGSLLTPPMSPGTVFFEGNQPLSHGTSAVYPPLVLSLAGGGGREPDAAHQLYRDVARAEAGSALSVAEVNRIWSRRARVVLLDEPARSARLLAGKLRLIFQAEAPHDVRGAWWLAQHLPLPAWPWTATAAAALAGLLLSLRPCGGEAAALRGSALELALLANQLAVLLLFYVSARQRLLLLVALAPFAATAGARLVEIGRRAHLRALAGLLGVALVTLVLLPSDSWMADSERLRAGAIANDRAFREIEALGDRLAPAERADRVVAAIAEAPWLVDRTRPAGVPLPEEQLLTRIADRLSSEAARSPSAAFDLAELELRLGRTAGARERLAALVASGARFNRGALDASDPRIVLARVDARRGDVASARRALDATLAESPGDPFALAERFVLSGDAADLARLERYFGRLDARWLVGRALLASNRPREAVAALREVALALPAARAAWIDLAAAFGASGQLDDGAEAYLRAMRLALQPLAREREVVALFRAWADAHPERLEAQGYALQVLFQHGHWREASEWLATHPALVTVPGVDAIARRVAVGEPVGQ